MKTGWIKELLKNASGMHFAEQSNKGNEACYLVHNITPRLSMQIHSRLQAYNIHDLQEAKTANSSNSITSQVNEKYHTNYVEYTILRSKPICMFWRVKISSHHQNICLRSPRLRPHHLAARPCACLVKTPVQNWFKTHWGVLDMKRNKVLYSTCTSMTVVLTQIPPGMKCQHHLDWAAAYSKQLQACLFPHCCWGCYDASSRALMRPWLSQKKASESYQVAKLNTQWRHLEASEVHNSFDENGVISNVRVLAIEFGEWAEERTAAGDVHLTYRSLERGGSDIRSKGINDVFPVALIQQHQSHLEARPARSFVYVTVTFLTKEGQCTVINIDGWILYWSFAENYWATTATVTVCHTQITASDWLGGLSQGGFPPIKLRSRDESTHFVSPPTELCVDRFGMFEKRL